MVLAAEEHHHKNICQALGVYRPLSCVILAVAASVSRLVPGIVCEFCCSLIIMQTIDVIVIIMERFAADRPFVFVV